MLVGIFGTVVNGPECSPSVPEVAEVCCEGFWRDFRCAPIGCPSDRSKSKVYIAKSPISAKTDQYPDLGQNLMFFFVLSTLDHSKRHKRGLRFVLDVLRAF